MEITQAEFIKSSSREQDCPEAKLPEYAFIGRSNVGKSSLINMLTNRKKLAKTSATPGKTQLINHFLINDAWYLVDLPGYGWAKVSKQDKQNWKKMIDRYLLTRKNLTNVFVLVDSRHDPQKIDVEFIDWLGNEEIPFCIVFTKADKLGKIKLQEQIASYKKSLLKTWDELPPCFVTSSNQKKGKNEILDYIEMINKSIS